MDTYRQIKQHVLGRRAFLAIILLVLVAVGVCLSLLMPTRAGDVVTVEVDGRVVAHYQLADTARVVRYNGVEVRIYDGQVQTVYRGGISRPIRDKGDRLVYPTAGVGVYVE